MSSLPLEEQAPHQTTFRTPARAGTSVGPCSDHRDDELAGFPALSRSDVKVNPGD
jgi:hypothetical protein